MKINLNKTPDEIAIEEAKKQRELELDVQKRLQERQEKIIALHKVQKRNKIIIISALSVFSLALLTFGTYNTFFKHQLDTNDVYGVIVQNVNVFPTDGLDNYIRDNCEAMFDQYVTIPQRTNYRTIRILPDTVSISRVRAISNVSSQVYFSADVEMTENDSVVDVQTVLSLRENGVIPSNVTTTNEQLAEVAPEATPTPEPTPVPPVEEWEIDEGSGLPIEPTTGLLYDVESGMVYVLNTDQLITIEEAYAQQHPEEITSDEALYGETPEEVVEEPEEPDTVVNLDDVDFDYSDTTGEEHHYYISAGGTVMERGAVTVVRYNFYVPVEFFTTYDGDIPATSGYRICGDLNMYPLVEPHQTNFDTIQTGNIYLFPNGSEADEDTTNSAEISVNNTLRGLYEGYDTSQNFMNYRPFNNYGATYNGVSEFYLYTTPNYMGYNAYVVYNITVPQGFSFDVHSYLTVEQSGTSWIITAIT